jgi:hypothetical protein
MENKCIRHGDVILMPIKSFEGAAEQHNQYTVAHGEVTGHHHTLYPLTIGAMLTLFQDGEKRAIKIDCEWSLKHQEHSELKIPAGMYEIGIEREYDPFQKLINKVVD